jgi:hypothetical protein
MNSKSHFRATICALSLFATACLSSEKADVMVYVNAARTYQFTFRDNVMRAGKLLPERRKSARKDILENEFIGRSTSKCSDNLYKCTNTGIGMLAIPRAGLTIGVPYTHRGAKFQPLKCLALVDDTCAVVLVRSECLRNVALECLSEATSSSGALTKKILYFIFHEELGVSAFVEGEGTFEQLQRHEVLEGPMYLRGNRGLLRD